MYDAKSVDLGRPKPPKMEPKIDPNRSKLQFCGNMRISFSYAYLQYLSDVGGLKMSYFWYFWPSKMSLEKRLIFGSTFIRFWVDFGAQEAPQEAPKSILKSIKKLIKIWMPFLCQHGRAPRSESLEPGGGWPYRTFLRSIKVLIIEG